MDVGLETLVAPVAPEEEREQREAEERKEQLRNEPRAESGVAFRRLAGV